MSSYEWIKVCWNKNYAPHYLPCCSHMDNPNLLLLLGVPHFVSDQNFEEFLSKYGSIVNIQSQKKPSAVPKFHIPNDSKFFRTFDSKASFRCVYVQFAASEGLSSFLRSAKLGLTFHISDVTASLIGTKKWANLYRQRYPDESELRKECEVYMAEYDEREKLKLAREKDMFENPDEDGWITVTKSTKIGASAESAQEKKNLYDKKMEKRKKEMLHLYSFQEREKRKETLAQLKQKFQEDREKIAKLKSARKFKPY